MKLESLVEQKHETKITKKGNHSIELQTLDDRKHVVTYVKGEDGKEGHFDIVNLERPDKTDRTFTDVKDVIDYLKKHAHVISAEKLEELKK